MSRHQVFLLVIKSLILIAPLSPIQTIFAGPIQHSISLFFRCSTHVSTSSPIFKSVGIFHECFWCVLMMAARCSCLNLAIRATRSSMVSSRISSISSAIHLVFNSFPRATSTGPLPRVLHGSSRLEYFCSRPFLEVMANNAPANERSQFTELCLLSLDNISSFVLSTRP